MGVRIRHLEDDHMSAWDKFVDASPDGTFFHKARWARIISRVFGHEAYYIYAEQDSSITGILPLVHVRTRLFGNVLVSSPFCVYGGPLTSNKQADIALREYSIRLCAHLYATSVEFRYRDRNEDEWQLRPELYATFRRDLDVDNKVNMKAIPRKQRAMIRRGIENGLRSRVGVDTRILYNIYSESVRNLGTPVFPREYFRTLTREFPDNTEVLAVFDNDIPIAAVLNFYYRDEVLPYYGGGTTAARRRAGNDFMYWEVMRRSAEKGYRKFDFGRSKVGTGAYSFKCHWGFLPSALPYRVYLVPGGRLADVNPLNPKYQLLIRMWRHLPVHLANALGPRLIGGLG